MGLIDLVRRFAGRPTGKRPPDPIFDELAKADSNGANGARGAFVGDLALPRDEVLTAHGDGDLALYRKLLQDDQVFPAFAQRRDAVIAREWRVDPGGDTELDARAADHLRQQLKRISWDRVTRKMLVGTMFGYSVGEVMWRRDGALIAIDQIKVRRSERFAFGTDGTLRLVDGSKPTPVPERKFWVFSSGAEDDDDPYGLGLGHYLYWPVWFKRNALRFWVTFMERFSSITVVGKVPNGTSDKEKGDLLGTLAAITGGGRVVIPKSVELELVQALRDSGGDYERFIARLDAAITKILLSQTMTSDNGSSLSQAQVHYRVQQATTKADADLVCESFMAQVATWLTEWNFPGAATPTLYRDFGESEDLAATAQRDVQLATIGWRPTEERVREVYGEGYEYSPPAPGAAPAFAEASFAPPAPNSVEDLLSGDGWERVMTPEVDAIERLLAEGRSLEEIRDRLGELALRSPAALADQLARVMFTARLAGNAAAELREEPKDEA